MPTIIIIHDPPVENLSPSQSNFQSELNELLNGAQQEGWNIEVHDTTLAGKQSNCD